MLQQLREKFSGLLGKIIFGIIVVVFGGFFGIQQYFNPRSETFVAKVDGHQISQQEFRDRYNNWRSRMQQIYGKAFDPQAIDTPESRKRILDELIKERLIMDVSDKLGVKVPVVAIQKQIQDIPNLQTNGKFDPEKYRYFLRVQHKSAEEFQEQVRQILEQQQLTDALALGTVVTDAQVNEYLRLSNQTRDFRFVKLDAPAPSGKISDKQIADYYKNNGKQFMNPEKVSLDYIELNAATMDVPTSVDDATLKAQYEEQKSHYVAPEQRLASHILISVDKNADAAKQKAALAKAKAIEKQLKDGKDFAALAKADSDDLGSRAQGGDLGWIEKGVTDPAFESALFSMKKGEVSAPVKSEEGYHIIWLRDVHARKARDFNDVKDELAKKYLAQERERRYSDISGKLADEVYQDPTALTPIAKKLGLTVRKTGLFSRAGGPGIAANPSVVKAAFSNTVLTEGNTSDPVTLGANHIVVVRVDQHEKATPKPLAEVHGAINNILIQQKVAKQASERADALYARLQKGATLDKIAAELKLKPTEEKAIGRDAANVDRALVHAVFELEPPVAGKTEPGKVALAGNAYALFELDAVKDGDPAKLDAKTREAARNTLRQAYGKQAVDEFIASLRKSAKVEISEERLQQ